MEMNMTPLASRLRSPIVAALMLVAASALTLSFALPAAAKKKKAAPAVVKASQNSALGKKIVVNAKGLTLYVLDPETKSKLLCTSSDCLAAWPLATVKSTAKLVKGSGVSGKLAKIKRGKKYQLTLGGKPLYTFTGESKGDAGGEGLKSFGGTWKVVSAGGGSSTPTTPGVAPPSY
jgi:predicted lipoprotein with Yx(FWY)xxD motif